MGNSSSKAAKTASKLSASNTARKYPTRTPPPLSNRTNVQAERPSESTKLGPTVYPEVRAPSERDQGINLDASDPDLVLNARMRQLGPVQPNPTLSNSSTFNRSTSSFSSPSSSSPNPSNFQASGFQASASSPEQTIFPNGNRDTKGRENPAVSLLTARYRLAEEAEREFAQTGRKGAKGRQFLDVVTIRQVLGMRERGVEGGEIERRLGLAQGVVGRLGGEGVVGLGGVE